MTIALVVIINIAVAYVLVMYAENTLSREA